MATSLTLIAAGFSSLLEQHETFRTALADLAVNKTSPPRADVEGCVASLMDVPDPLPGAALTWALDFDTPMPGVVLRADPVHLQAMANGLLLERYSESLSAAEREALATALASTCEAVGGTLMPAQSGRWYLCLPKPPDASFTSPARAAAAGMAGAMPQGPDGANWTRLLSDMQIELHHCAFNEARLEAGSPAITSLWFWGLSQEVVTPSLMLRGGDHPVVEILGGPRVPVAAHPETDAVEVWDLPGEGAESEVQRGLTGLRERTLASLRLIDPGVQQWTVTRRPSALDRAKRLLRLTT